MDRRLRVYLDALRLDPRRYAWPDNGSAPPRPPPLGPLLGALRPPPGGLRPPDPRAWRPPAALTALLPRSGGAAFLAVAAALRHGEPDLDAVAARLAAVLGALDPAVRRGVDDRLGALGAALAAATTATEVHDCCGLLRAGDACGVRTGPGERYCAAVPCLGSAFCWAHRVLLLRAPPAPPLGASADRYAVGADEAAG